MELKDNRTKIIAATPCRLGKAPILVISWVPNINHTPFENRRANKILRKQSSPTSSSPTFEFMSTITCENRYRPHDLDSTLHIALCLEHDTQKTNNLSTPMSPSMTTSIAHHAKPIPNGVPACFPLAITGPQSLPPMTSIPNSQTGITPTWMNLLKGP